jgi:hypothetical protein
MIQVLVLHDGGDVDLRQLVLAHVGQGAFARTHLDATVGILVHVDVSVDQSPVACCVRQHVDLSPLRRHTEASGM